VAVAEVDRRLDFRSYVPWQVIASTSWFLMDGLWLYGLYFEVLITLGAVSFVAHLVVLMLDEKQPVTLAVNAAETCWLSFNALWLVHDFHDLTWALTSARVLFIVGGVLLVYALVTNWNRGAFGRSGRFRRLHTGVD
jgi:hypothetical protein